MSDLIDRQVAINAVNDVLSHYIPLFRNDQEGIPLKCDYMCMNDGSVPFEWDVEELLKKSKGDNNED